MWFEINRSRTTPGAFGLFRLREGRPGPSPEERLAGLHETMLALFKVGQKPSLARAREIIQAHGLQPTFKTHIAHYDNKTEDICVFSVSFENDHHTVIFRMFYEG